MTIAIKITMVLALVLGILLPTAYFFSGERKKGRLKKALAGNIVFFFGCLIVASVMMFSASPAFAETEEAAATAASGAGLGYIAAALSTGLSCLGGGFAVANAASAALGALSEDSTVFGKSLIFVGLAEGVCLYGLIISFMILSKI